VKHGKDVLSIALPCLIKTMSIPPSIPDPALLAALLEESAKRHRHLCPRQVLGIRMALRGLWELGFVDNYGCPRFYNENKRLLSIVETDGCGMDGIAVTTSCSVGRRTLRVLDFGKVAATLVDTTNEHAVRVVPHPQARTRAKCFAPDAPSRWHGYLEAYQVMPDAELLLVTPVILTQTLAEILSKPGARAVCEACGEEIINEREVIRAGRVLCRACAGEGYYRPLLK
jgi:formylmethanofuran dehydrogenase subunit E